MKVFVARRLPGPAWSPEGFTVDTFEGAEPASQAELLRRARDADAVITLLSHHVDAAFFDACPKVRIVANYAVGLDNIDLEAAAARGVWVTHTPDVLTSATADLTWALVLGVARRLREADRRARSDAPWRWDPSLLLGMELEGATLGIVGLGRIGRAVAARGRAFGMRVIGRTRSAGPPLHQILRESDVLSLHAPLTPDTRHLIDEEALSSMKPGSVLINTSRGPLVDEAALVRALEDGPLIGAGLDVFENEPEVHPGLVNRDDVLLLPHIGSATVRTRHRMAAMTYASVEAALRGERPPHIAGAGKETT